MAKPTLPAAEFSPLLAQHTAIERIAKSDAGVTDEVGYTFRAVDTIAAMHRAGSIDNAQFVAARRFRDDFDRAHLEGQRAADYTRAVVDCRPSGDLSSTNYAARDRVWLAIVAVGGMRTLCGSALWHIVGLGDSLSEWATLHGRVHKLTAAGILMAALGVLASHYVRSRQ